MRSNISSKRASLAAGIVLLASFSVIVFFLFGQGSYTKQTSLSNNQIQQNLLDTVKSIQAVASAQQASLPSVQTGSDLPIRLTIPKIRVDAAVKYVSLAPDGAMDVPKSPADVAWWSLGPRPGEPGSAVISGHYGWKDGMPAVFDELHTLQKGDRILIEDEKGVSITFVVREKRTYNENEGSSEVFGSSDGKEHLNLVTCTGVWNKARKSYSQRLVVFADKE